MSLYGKDAIVTRRFFTCGVLCTFLLFRLNNTNALDTFKLEIVEVSPSLIKPITNEQAKIVFRSERDGQALVKIFDRRSYQVREFAIEHIAANEPITVAWNGKDDQGEWVPDEAYFFTIEATDIKGNIAEYDSTSAISPPLTPMPVTYDAERKQVSYTVDSDSVIDIRSGVTDGGPLLVKQLEWKPHLKGNYSFAWDGWDKTHTIDVASIAKHQLFSQVAPLPEFSILTTGNPNGIDQIYSLVHPQETLKLKATNPSSKPSVQLDPSPYKSLSPTFNFEFNDAQPKENELPKVGNKTNLTIRLQESVKQKVTETRYEILVFVDYKFLTEIEEGRSPAKMNVDTASLAPGEHVLTINLITLQGGLATVSKKFIKSNE